MSKSILWIQLAIFHKHPTSQAQKMMVGYIYPESGAAEIAGRKLSHDNLKSRLGAAEIAERKWAHDNLKSRSDARLAEGIAETRAKTESRLDPPLKLKRTNTV